MYPILDRLFPGDFITLESPSDAGRVAVVIGVTASGNLRVRRCRPFDRRHDHIRTYQGPWNVLPITDERHPLYEPPELGEAS